jgi:hypothetical protein
MLRDNSWMCILHAMIIGPVGRAQWPLALGVVHEAALRGSGTGKTEELLPN